MQVRTVRSGLTESRRTVSVLAVDESGAELHRSGDPDTPVFYRSVVKPLQATAALEAGVDVPDEHLAVMCASHGGYPVHTSLVRSMLAGGAIPEAALQSTRSLPSAPGARFLLARAGRLRARPLFHNCSGKHAGMLLACRARGWTFDDYRDPEHPLQVAIRALLAEATGESGGAVGVDGCGAPTFQGSVRGVAGAFSRISSEPRHGAVADVMTRFPALLADNLTPVGRLGSWWGGPVKVGAEGLIGLGRHGIGIAAKSDGGDERSAVIAAVTTARDLELLSPAMEAALAGVVEPPVLGWGQPVGSVVAS